LHFSTKIFFPKLCSLNINQEDIFELSEVSQNNSSRNVQVLPSEQKKVPVTLFEPTRYEHSKVSQNDSTNLLSLLSSQNNLLAEKFRFF
jgi:hypothetical protein